MASALLLLNQSFDSFNVKSINVNVRELHAYRVFVSPSSSAVAYMTNLLKIASTETGKNVVDVETLCNACLCVCVFCSSVCFTTLIQRAIVYIVIRINFNLYTMIRSSLLSDDFSVAAMCSTGALNRIAIHGDKCYCNDVDPLNTEKKHRDTQRDTCIKQIHKIVQYKSD